MENKTQTNKNLPNFVIIQDGEVVNDQYIEAPTALNIASEGISRAVEVVKLEARMFVFDALHRTNYRSIRHDLVREQKRRKFEESIGLVATGRK